MEASAIEVVPVVRVFIGDRDLVPQLAGGERNAPPVATHGGDKARERVAVGHAWRELINFPTRISGRRVLLRGTVCTKEENVGQ